MPTFEVMLLKPEEAGSWTYFNAPFSVEAVFGTRGQVKVRGTYSYQGRNAEFRSSLMPVGDGAHYIVVNRQLREAIGAAAGDMIQVTMERDTEARRVNVPPELQALLDAQKGAAAVWAGLSYSHQKEYVDWISEAKTAATRQKRLEGTLERLLAGKRLK
jgi:hypothetical protein